MCSCLCVHNSVSFAVPTRRTSSTAVTNRQNNGASSAIRTTTDARRPTNDERRRRTFPRCESDTELCGGHRRYRRDKRAAPFWSSLKPWRLLSRSRVLASNERAEQRTCEVMRTSCGLPCRRKPGWCAFDGKAGGVAFSSFVYVVSLKHPNSS